MFIPIGDEEKTIRIPFVNYAIVAVNAIVFFVITVPMEPFAYAEFIEKWGTVPAQLNPVTLVTSAFLHGGFFHILFNMLFLWVFGDNIEDRLGHLLYLAFYIGGAVCADFIYAAANSGSSIPAIGASGAVAAVMGAYMMMLPKVKVKFFYFFYYRAGVFAISAIYAIGLWALLQVFYYVALEAEGLGGVAYSAHLGGFGYGLVAGAIAAIILKSIRREQIEMVDRWRGEKTSAQRLSVTPHGSGYTEGALRKQREFEARPERLRGPRPLTHNYVSEAQENVVSLLSRGKEKEALEQYLAFIRKFRYASLPAQEQLRIADLFLTTEQYRPAQEAYERFLRHYPQGRHADEVKFNLAMLCAQYTQDYSTARRLLKELIRSTGDSVKLVQLEEELSRVEEHFAKIYAEPPASEASGTDTTEEYAVFRQSSEQINIPEVGRVIAAMLKLPLADVTTRLFTCSGFLADRLKKHQAEILARDLQKIKVPVFLVEQNRLQPLPEALLVGDATFNTEGFKGGVEGEVGLVPWDSIIMVNAGLLESSRTKEVSTGSDAQVVSRSAFGFGTRRRKTALVKQTQRRTVIDLITREPWQRFRIQEGFTRFALMGEQKLPTISENFEKLAQEVVRHADRTFIGKAVSELAKGGRLNDFVYENKRKYDLINFWLLHRALYDTPA
jgi:membrane associated rhomboid family serine protease